MTEVSTEEPETVTKKPETTTDHEKPREKKERIRPPTKVVIRRLPPSLTKESFINQVSPLPEYDYLYFVHPDKSLGPFAFSRAYINFIKQEDIFTFKEQFDNYTFMDKKGNEYPAVVEFAPFQRLPKKRLGRKKDLKMGTLEQDPAYVSFLESREARSTESRSAQHCPLEYFPPPENSEKKITTTPLLDFLRQRRAERQRMRDERREERRRKDQERKRLKDADRDRRRVTGKPESGSVRDASSDTVLKVLRNPEHEKETKDDSNKGGANKENKDKVQTLGPGTKKREDDRQRINIRDKERERKDRQIQDTRPRENKGHGSIKSYRDDRQKQMEIRAQRKLPDDQRRKPSFERGQSQTKSSENRQNFESDKIQNTTKTSDTRRSQEFDRSQGPSRSNKGKEYERMDHRKHYQSSDIHKTNERYQNQTSRDGEYRRSYKDSDYKRTSYNKDGDQKRNSYVKSSRVFGETDSRKSSTDQRNYKDDEMKQKKEESSKSEKQGETKKWEQMGAKPKKKTTSDENENSEINEEKMNEVESNEESSSNKTERRNSLESTEFSKSSETKQADDREKSEECDEGKCCVSEEKLEVNETDKDENKKAESASSGHTYGAKPSKRRGSLDSGDHESEGSKGMRRSATGSDWSMDSKLKRNHSLDLDGHSWEIGDGDGKSLDKSETRKDRDDKGTDTCGNGENKRDPRLERRIRNKDRPSIEIYRPGMGRFSLQRKEREKGSGSAAGSSVDQESPSSSPSPTPTYTNRIIGNPKSSKSVTELRSMTFKRSISREK
ncbi:hypothetical protein L9F63_018807 [Diploptera punctata]|uniref:UPF3 domain-containing protein n=1 Tax=Diploptera punctata TaxID=6984 RepID=A0AAD7ZW40_DIPPU|nr:hypothetical protein L9F63_018807 [Diploptera punctata]